jgi:GTP pyrophosphokinase
VKKLPENSASFDAQVRDICGGFDDKGAGLIMAAYAMASRAHENQKRLSGEPYIIHSIEVAKILKELRMDAATIAAGLLHDVLEDTQTSLEEMKKATDENVAFLVEGVSHVTAKVFKTRGEIFSESLKKMFLAMAKDIRVVIIKLADRLHNMRTIRFLDQEKQRVISQETMNIYAPLAHRLGMEKIKSELEDMSFAVLNPQAYREIASNVAEKREERQQRIELLKEMIQKEVEKMGIKAEITGRPKHFYSIYQKMMKENKKFENIYDLIALRVITGALGNCYTILGIVHNMWKPLPGRFKDYIAMPKSNMYQSLHTTVLDQTGRPVEIQIRTFDMDLIAEEGIAAHWNYKEERTFDKKTDSAYVWVRQLLDWHSNLKESDEFIKELKVDLFDEEVFVFTPRGEVKELVKGSTVLDFAYSVHSDLGDKCIGAKVNGKWVTIKYELQNGDRVDILKGANQHPVVDWLKTAKTAKAKNRIRHWLRTNQNISENIEKGRSLLAEKLAKYDFKMEDVAEESWGQLLEHYNLKDRDDLFAGIGYGEFSDFKISNALIKVLKEKKHITHGTEIKKQVARGEIVVQGDLGDVAYKFARCCNPVPGDEITGIFTKKGISVHRKNCVTLGLSKITTPLVDVNWNEQVNNFYMSKLKIAARNREGLINDILTTVAQNSAYISYLNSTAEYENRLQLDMSINVKGRKHLSDLMTSIRKVKDVLNVERVD